MPRNGSGSYNLPNGPFVPSTVISSTTMNQNLSDLGTALTQSIANDGQTTPVANLPMATFRHTNVGNAQARTDYAAAGQVQDGAFQWLTSIAGTDTITASLTPSPGAYTAGQVFRFVPAGTNTTTAVTLNINGLGAKAITKNGTVALAPGDLVGGTIFEVIYDGTQFQLKTAAATAIATSAYCVRGLVGVNNTGTPNTKYDLSADAVTLKSVNGTPDITRFGVGAITNDIGLAGSAANGRDQAGAFSASSWIHFYFIFNGTTLATLSSTVAPGTGPTMPTGYTHWAYAGAVYYNATPLLVKTRIRGAMAFYEFPTAALTNGPATTETAVSLIAFVPPNAVSFIVDSQNFSITADGTGQAYAQVFVRCVSGFNFSCISRIATAATANSGQGATGAAVEMPNLGQNLYYINNVINGTTPQATLNINGYKMPNGGE